MTRRFHVSIKDAARRCMEEAYLKASAGGTLPAHARQIMYAARPYIIENADREMGNDFDQYFTQTLLPDYIEEHGVSWNVVYDARGNFTEPHTDERFALGTLQARDYLGEIEAHKVPDLSFSIWEGTYPTVGPKNRYGAILFIEKEGFMPLFQAVELAKRYDIAIMSTKGMSVTAARELLDRICKEHSVPLLVLHDFDKAGFSILGTLHRDTRRYRFDTTFKVIDLGLRLKDIGGLVSEEVAIEAGAADNLRRNGATEKEIAWLMQGQRVELNAFASDELIAFIERKLAQHGIAKVIPDQSTLADAYRRMHRQAAVQVAVNEAVEGLDDEEVPVIKGLQARIRKMLKAQPTISWDAALRTLVEREQ